MSIPLALGPDAPPPRVSPESVLMLTPLKLSGGPVTLEMPRLSFLSVLGMNPQPSPYAV